MGESDKRIYVQFSKRIAGVITAFWCIYHVLLLILTWLRPEIGSSLDKMLTGVDDVMMVSIGFYTGNSVIEKGIAGYFGKRNSQNEQIDNSNTSEG